MCIKQPVDTNFESAKGLNLLLALTAPFFLILIFMLSSIIYVLRSRGIKKRNYRRNVLSLKETFFYTIFILVFFFGGSLLIKFYAVLGFSVDGIRFYSFMQSLVVHNLLEGVIWPIYVLWNIQEKMPEFYSDRTNSVQKFCIIGQNTLEPRRIDVNTDSKYDKWNIPRKVSSNVALHQMNQNSMNSISELPTVQ